MKHLKKLILAFAGLTAGLFPAYSQTVEDEINALLRREVEVENPVYMPVLGVGIGYFNFFGNVNDPFRTITGQPGYRINVSTFIGKKHYYRANLTFMMGGLSGTRRYVPKEPSDEFKNLNFKSDIYSFGLNFHYSFKPLIKGKFFEPFVSVGIETLQFDSKADYTYGDDKRPYYYWTDGTIRDGSEISNPNANIISRDFIYEEDLRKLTEKDLGLYSQFTAAIPVDIGIDFNVSNRVTLRAATSLHYALSNVIDGMSLKAKEPYKGEKSYNMYTFSYLSLHLDLFSSDKVKIVEDLFADIDDFDMSMYEDEDGDGVFDFADQCPGTPYEIPVDSVGCPFDTDGDGVPDYLDREPNSRPGAIVDEYGVEISEDMVLEILNAGAIRRRDVESYLMMHKAQNRARRTENLPIPEKFKQVDRSGDGYISFDELMRAINDFFDGSSGYSPDDVRELNDFFFEQ